MRIIAIVNQKGGSGKTTTAVNLAAALAEKGKTVLLIDIDAQANASTWYGVVAEGRGLLDVLADNGNVIDLVQATATAGVDIVPASPWLVGAEKALAGEVGAETILRRALARLPEKRWDYVLIDCPPTLGILTVNALTAVNEVFVPVEAHVMALSGLAQLLNTVELVGERLNSNLKVTGILACRMNRTRHATEVLDQLRARFGSTVFQSAIRENVRLAECPSFAQPITAYDARSNGAEDYRSLATEVIAQE
jgi:chromosome partitioning protein